MGADVANPDLSATLVRTIACGATRNVAQAEHREDANTGGAPLPSLSNTHQHAAFEEKCDDEQLIRGIAASDRQALSLLFRRYASMVRVLGERILRDAAEAEDLVQEVFLFVHRKAGLFDPRLSSARSWLIQVTYHRAFDRRRYLSSRRFYSNLTMEEAILQTDGPASPTTWYDDSIEAALGRDVLGRIEESLSEIQHRVLRLYFFEGYTVPEIAGMLGQSEGNVRNHYYRALEKMRREIFAPKLQSK